MIQDYILDATSEKEENRHHSEFSEEEFDSLMERKVTLCVAAKCQNSGQPRIVLCNDWKATEQYGSAENRDKLRVLKKGWVALKAGPSSKGEELIGIYRRFLRSIAITHDNCFEVLRRPLFLQFAALKEAYCRRVLGIRYAEFRRTWKERFGEQDARVHSAHMAKLIDLESRLIIAGFIGDAPVIFHTTKEGEVIQEDNLAAIGDGRFIAQPNLLRRLQESSMSVSRTMYHVYESKKLSEVMDSVGGYTSLDVLYPSGRIQSLSTKGHTYMQKMYDKFAPPRATGLKIEKEHLEPFDWEDFAPFTTPRPKSTSQTLESEP